MSIRGQIRKTLLRFGYDVIRRNPDALGFDPFKDMKSLTNGNRAPVLFDIGANTGQTIASYRKIFSDPIIHAFEPSPSTFTALKEQTVNIPNLHLSGAALGSKRERKVLIENSIPTLSSLLPPNTECWGEIVNRTEVDVNSIDSYCQETGVTHIDVLKSDTQGFDLEVLKGGLEMLRQHRVHLVFIELNFCDLYVGLAHFDEIYLFLKDLGLVPVAFYNQNIRNSSLGWADGLFIDPQYRAV